MRVSSVRGKCVIAISAVVSLVVLYLAMLPVFVRVQGINTPRFFPDPNFRKSVEVFMQVEPGGQLTREQAEANTGHLNCSNMAIETLKGIEIFKNITGLVCGKNKLKELNVSNNTELTELQCYENQLTSLDVSHNLKLTVLNFADNQISSIDVSRNVNLVKLGCHNDNPSAEGVAQNHFTALDVSHNVKLNVLFVHNNQLSRIDVSNNINLEHFKCFNNLLTKLDVSNNHHLWMLWFQGNPIQELVVNPDAAIHSLRCDDTAVTHSLIEQYEEYKIKHKNDPVY